MPIAQLVCSICGLQWSNVNPSAVVGTISNISKLMSIYICAMLHVVMALVVVLFPLESFWKNGIYINIYHT